MLNSYEASITNGSPLFGNSADEKMYFSDFGQIADECWRNIPDFYPNVILGNYVIMPNHMHGTLYLTSRLLSAMSFAVIRAR